MNHLNLNLAITGATGYIGRHLINIAKEKDIMITSLSRKNPSIDGVYHQYFDLESITHNLDLTNVDVVVHLAAITDHNETVNDLREINAARYLISKTLFEKKFLIYVSSQSAIPKAPTSYGKIKWQIENEIINAGGTVIRPGLVYGGRNGGMFRKIISFLQSGFILPQFKPDISVSTTHIDDLINSIIMLASNTNTCGKTFNLIEVERYSVNNLLKGICDKRLFKIKILIPTYIGIIYIIKGIIGRRLSARLGLLQLISLIESQHIVESDLYLFNKNGKCFADFIERDFAKPRRTIIFEAYVLLKYILRSKPSNQSIKFYVKAIQALREPNKLEITPMMARFSFLLSIYELKSKNKLSLKNKIEIASVVAETSIQGYERFLGLNNNNKNSLECYFSILNILFKEFLILSLSKIFGYRVKI